MNDEDRKKLEEIETQYIKAWSWADERGICLPRESSEKRWLISKLREVGNELDQAKRRYGDMETDLSRRINELEAELAACWERERKLRETLSELERGVVVRRRIVRVLYLNSLEIKAIDDVLGA